MGVPSHAASRAFPSRRIDATTGPLDALDAKNCRSFGGKLDGHPGHRQRDAGQRLGGGVPELASSDAPESWLEVEQRGRQPTLLLIAGFPVVHLAGALLDPLIRDVHLETRVQACNVQVNAK